MLKGVYIYRNTLYWKNCRRRERSKKGVEEERTATTTTSATGTGGMRSGPPMLRINVLAADDDDSRSDLCSTSDGHGVGGPASSCGGCSSARTSLSSGVTNFFSDEPRPSLSVSMHSAPTLNLSLPCHLCKPEERAHDGRRLTIYSGGTNKLHFYRVQSKRREKKMNITINSHLLLA